jgi:hypothetical protein
MNKEMFETAVQRRAHQRVMEKLDKFNRDIQSALVALTGSNYVDPKNDLGLMTIGEISSMYSGKKWPRSLWETEQIAVRNELFNLMDPIQKALMAPEPKDGDPMPDDTSC